MRLDLDCSFYITLPSRGDIAESLVAMSLAAKGYSELLFYSL
jgi:hypothetical protein